MHLRSWKFSKVVPQTIFIFSTQNNNNNVKEITNNNGLCTNVVETKFIRTEKSECIGLIIRTVGIAIDDDLGFDTDYIQTKKALCEKRKSPLDG